MGVRKLNATTYKITEHGSFGRVNMYLLIGKDKALLIDSGYGKSDLKKIISKLTDKPVTCMLTHGHCGFIGGSDVYPTFMNTKEMKNYDLHGSEEFQKKHHLPVHKKASAPFPMVFEPIDLGERTVYVEKTPGHTLGSVCFFDPSTRTVFCGDTINPLVSLGLDDSTSVTQYQGSLLKIQRLCEEYKIKKYQGSHNFFTMNNDIMTDLFYCIEKILDSQKGHNYKKQLSWGKKTRFLSASIVWRKI